jgi:hypothetical protein
MNHVTDCNDLPIFEVESTMLIEGECTRSDRSFSWSNNGDLSPLRSREQGVLLKKTFTLIPLREILIEGVKEKWK